MSDSASKNESSIQDKFNIRFIALGAFVIFLSLFGGEKLVWKLVDPATQQFLNDSLQQVGSPDISDEQKEAIRSETISRLSTPAIIGVGISLLLVPFFVGMLLGFKSQALLNAPIAVLLGIWVTFAVIQAVSLGSLVASLAFAGLSVPGTLIAKKIQNWPNK